MKIDRTLLITLWILACLLAANMLAYVFQAQPVAAAKEGERIGRYQISSWATQTGSYTSNTGYFVLDTTTGKIIDQKHHEYGGVEGKVFNERY